MKRAALPVLLVVLALGGIILVWRLSLTPTPPAPAKAPKVLSRGRQPNAPPDNATPEELALGQQMYQLINQDRANPAYAAETGGKAKPLVWDDAMATVARVYSQQMRDLNFFAHDGPDGLTPTDREDRAGILWTASAENLAKYMTIAQAETGFMSEPANQSNHRANILAAKYTHIGIGIARTSNGLLYITQDFRRDPSDGAIH